MDIPLWFVSLCNLFIIPFPMLYNMMVLLVPWLSQFWLSLLIPKTCAQYSCNPQTPLAMQLLKPFTFVG